MRSTTVQVHMCQKSKPDATYADVHPPRCKSSLLGIWDDISVSY